MNDKWQVVVAGAMTIDSKPREHFFWPVTRDVIWVRRTNDPWQKLRRAAAS